MTRKVDLLNEWKASKEYETIHFTDWLVKRIAELEKENARLKEERREYEDLIDTLTMALKPNKPKENER